MNEELLREYIVSLQKRIERLSGLKGKLAEGNAKADENIRLMAHSLHGSGTSFGFPEITEAGRAVEHADQASLPQKLDMLIKVLEGIVAKRMPAAPAASDPARGQPVASNKTAKPAEVKPAETSKQIRVLVIEDDAEVARLITHTLQGLPKKWNIQVALSASKAQEAIVKGTYDLIIMDLILPDRDGRELINEIKTEFRLATPLLVLSSLLSDSVRVECMSLGADKYLTKPFNAEELNGEIQKLIGKKLKKKLTLVPMDGEAPEDDDADAGPGPLTGKSILLAEDDKIQANLTRQRLMDQGAAVKHANNGREAMQLIRGQEFALIILDVKMPMMDGFEVLQRVRGELKLETPVIMVTALGSEDDIIRGYDLGATDYILKPFSEVQLVARIKSLLK